MQASGEQVRRGDMLYRQLGTTGQEVSVIGLGGSHIGQVENERESVRLIRSAIDRGIIFMDNSWDYGEGKNEIWMGKALRDGYRHKVFLMSKIDARKKQAAAKQIDESLLRLQVGHVDLMQFHELIRPHEPDVIFGEDGAFEAMIEAQKAGKVRFIGFTGHKDPFIHLRMLETAQARGFHFDAVQMPLNVMDAHFRSFEKQVLPVLNEQGIGCIGMKCFAEGLIPESKTVSPMECLHYVLNLPMATLVTGIESMEILDQACEAVRTFKPLSEAQLKAILDKTRDVAGTGKKEPFKTTFTFDTTDKHPQWLGLA
jgi:aryl-alcohol dehydrogenase-like predicted oxidoreductase